MFVGPLRSNEPSRLCFIFAERLVKASSATRHALGTVIFGQLNVRADNDFPRHSILSSTEDLFHVMYELFKGDMTDGLGKRV